MHNVTAFIIFKVMANMMTDEDFDFLEKVYNKLRSAKITGSSVRLNSAEIKIILKNREDLMAMFDDENDKELC